MKQEQAKLLTGDMEDPIMVAEFTIYLEQNYCIGDQLGIEMVLR